MKQSTAISHVLIVLACFFSGLSQTRSQQDGNDIIELVSEDCVDSEAAAVDFLSANATWKEPGCYKFEYAFLGFTLGPPVYEKRTVINGTAVNLTDREASMPLQTLQHFYDLIYNFCVKDCPEKGAHLCRIQYNSKTIADSAVPYPSRIFIDVEKFAADEERIYRIVNVTGCPARSEQVGGIKDEPDDSIGKTDTCVDSKKASTAWNQAADVWQASNPACYSYVVERLGRIRADWRGPYHVLVDDEVARVTGRPAVSAVYMNRTMNGWLDYIYQTCLVGCLEGNRSASAHLCRVEYDSTFGFPMDMYIDPDDFKADEELHYVISNFTTTSCTTDGVNSDPSENEQGYMNASPETLGPSIAVTTPATTTPTGTPTKSPTDTPSQAPDVATTNCVNYVNVSNSWQNAVDRWQEVPCYMYTLEVLGRLPPEQRGPFRVNVTGGEAVALMSAPEWSGANRTIQDWLDLIEHVCLSGCSRTEGENSTDTAFNCVVSYDPEIGVPLELYFNYDQFIADEEARYHISNYTVCSPSSPATNASSDNGNNPIPNNHSASIQSSNQNNESTTCKADTVVQEWYTLVQEEWTRRDPSCYNLTVNHSKTSIAHKIANVTNDVLLPPDNVHKLLDLVRLYCLGECPLPEPQCIVEFGTVNINGSTDVTYPASIQLDFGSYSETWKVQSIQDVCANDSANTDSEVDSTSDNRGSLAQPRTDWVTSIVAGGFLLLFV